MNLSTYTNIHGEEWIAYSERGALFIRGRDVDWDACPVDLETGIASLPDGAGLVLEAAEAMWVIACAYTQRELNKLSSKEAP